MTTADKLAEALLTILDLEAWISDMEASAQEAEGQRLIEKDKLIEAREKVKRLRFLLEHP